MRFILPQSSPHIRKVLLICLVMLLLIGCQDDYVLRQDASQFASLNQRRTRDGIPDNSGLPEVGSVYSDPAYKTSVVRISNATATPRIDDNGNLPLVTQEYSTMSPFNSDNSRLLLTHYSYFGLYDGEGKFIRDLPLEINASSQPRWSRTDPDVFYYIRDNQLKRFDISTDTGKKVHTFGEYTTISGHGESDISYDGDHFALAGDGEEIFVYTLSSDKKGRTLNIRGTEGFDNLQITPDNNVIVGWLKSGTERFSGYELFDADMNFVRQITTVLGHSDVARDTNGDEVLLLANGGDPKPPANCENAVVKINLEDGRQTCLITFDWSLGRHISAADNKGWFIVSTYTGNSGIKPSSSIFANEILQVTLDGMTVRRLVRHGSEPLNDYVYQPRASVSRDGTRVVYADNHGLSGTRGFSRDYVDTYMLKLEDDLSSGVPAEKIAPFVIPGLAEETAGSDPP